MPRDQYRALYEGFRWHVPREFNIADMCGRRWAPERSRVAILQSGRGQRCAATPTRRCSPRPIACPMRSPRSASARDDRVAIVLRPARRNRDRPSRDLPDGRDRDAAVGAVRPRGARVPAAGQRRAARRSSTPRRCPIAALRERCPASAHVIGVDGAQRPASHEWVQSWSRLLSRADAVRIGRARWRATARCSSTRAARPGRRRARSCRTRADRQSARLRRTRRTGSRSRATCSGRPPTGRGPAA